MASDDLGTPSLPHMEDVRYIKLGEGGRFAQSCIEAGELGLSFASVPHDLCVSGDWERVSRVLHQGGSGAATRQVGELRDFYTLDTRSLWITFFDGCLWWTSPSSAVEWRSDLAKALPRRRATSGWRNTSVDGHALRTNDLNIRLTQVARFKGTICKVAERDYLRRRLRGEPEPLVLEAGALGDQLRDLALRLIKRLHEKDFEILVDIILNASGWRRVSVLGETAKDIDLLVEQVATGERAFVQVKSRADEAVLNDYIERFQGFDGATRMFFACHSPTAGLRARAAEATFNGDVWLDERLADKAINAGLFSWLVQHVR